MKITICGSISFQEQMLKTKEALESQGHEVLLPHSAQQGLKKEWWDTLSTTDPERFMEMKANYIRGHFEKVALADAILVLNYDKNGIKNYIGGNTLMEMALAFYLKKKIFLLNDAPDVSYREEIIGMEPIILHADINRIN